MILTTNAVTKTSGLYNISFCIVPTPALESRIALPRIAYNIHSNKGEGDGGDGYTILIDHTRSLQTFEIVRVHGNAIERIVDISSYVDDNGGGNVYPGGTAFCASSSTLWVAIQTKNPSFDTLLSISLASNTVLTNISMVKPALASHFADCSTNSVGGFTQQASIVQVGMLSATGAFTVLDSLALPAGTPSNMRLAAIGDFMHISKWAASEYGAILYTGKYELPGLLFVSQGKPGSATLVPLNVVAASVSVEY